MSEGHDEILEKVRSIIAKVVRKPIQEVGKDTSLVKDLGCESIDFVDIVFELEQKFHVELDMSAYEQLQEIFGEDALAVDGMLTSLGVRIMRARLPDVELDDNAEGMPEDEIQTLFTPAVWTRAIEELVAARPQECTNCGATDLELDNECVACVSCNHEMPYPTQEEVLRVWAAPYLAEISRGMS